MSETFEMLDGLDGPDGLSGRNGHNGLSVLHGPDASQTLLMRVNEQILLCLDGHVVDLLGLIIVNHDKGILMEDLDLFVCVGRSIVRTVICTNKLDWRVDTGLEVPIVLCAGLDGILALRLGGIGTVLSIRWSVIMRSDAD
jgi:hypothetical protein